MNKSVREILTDYPRKQERFCLCPALLNHLHQNLQSPFNVQKQLNGEICHMCPVCLGLVIPSTPFLDCLLNCIVIVSIEQFPTALGSEANKIQKQNIV